MTSRVIRDIEEAAILTSLRRFRDSTRSIDEKSRDDFLARAWQINSHESSCDVHYINLEDDFSGWRSADLVDDPSMDDDSIYRHTSSNRKHSDHLRQ